MSLMSPSFDIYSHPPCIILSTTGHMNFPHMEAHFLPLMRMEIVLNAVEKFFLLLSGDYKKPY